MPRAFMTIWGSGRAPWRFGCLRVGVFALGLAGLACGGDAGSENSPRSTGSSSPVGGAGGAADAGSDEPLEPPVSPFEPPPIDDTPFEDPGCPPVSAPPPDLNQCNPLATPSGCPDGEACFPFVSYPSGPCEVELFGAMCRLAGSGTQGQSCANDGCAADHVCVSTGRGTQCTRLCRLEGVGSVCDPGLLCLPIDIEGYGGCL
jgi:hypothetical protein